MPLQEGHFVYERRIHWRKGQSPYFLVLLDFAKSGVSVILGSQMKPHAIPRSLLIMSLTLVALIFLAGTLSAFSNAHAATSAAATATAIGPDQPSGTPAPSITPVSGNIPGDTSGDIAMAVVMIVVILFGILWGGHRPRKRQESKK